MKSVLAILCSLCILASVDAGDRKSKGRGAWAYAVACSQQPAKAVAAPVKSEPVKTASSVVGEASTSGSCASGSCGTSTTSGLFRRSRR